ncbi:tRNA-dihydrouridine(47) synthase [NAD(P)(+)]-like protein [Bulinus truncatus]|nr:tRNA-dihydrouridine(47) synthase [NAD(P)(+)]-like protein [Bulinus truncatus]
MEEYLPDKMSSMTNAETVGKNNPESLQSTEMLESTECAVTPGENLNSECSEENVNTKSDDIIRHKSQTPDISVASDSTSQTSKTDVTRKPGYACIKSEYLVLDYKPVLHTEYLSSADAQRLQMEHQDQSDSDDEPPAKKAKLKGRNKQRPVFEKVQAKDKICPSVQQIQVCSFGDKCIYNHDKEDFMKRKLPDLDGPCYLFDTFGKCHYSIACRFAKNHLTEDFNNIVNVELWEKMKNCKPLNELSAEVKKKLWKKKYNFRLADKIVKDVGKNYQGGWNTKKDSPVVTADVSSSNSDSGISQGNNSVSVPVSLANVPVNGAISDSELLKDNGFSKDGMQNNSAGCISNVVETGGGSLDKSASPTKEFQTGADTKSDTPCLQSENAKLEKVGCLTDEDVIPLRSAEKVRVDFRNKLYLAPLTTVGNLPFRRICKSYGADITCGEMALSMPLLKAKLSEWSLVKRHPSEDIFGVQLCGSYPDTMTRCAQLLSETSQVDFIDINCGCPIDLICKKGAGSALMSKPGKLEQICRSVKGVIGDMPLTVKLRTGEHDGKNVAHNLIPRLRSAGVSMVTIHGRSKAQRYTRLADWDYIGQCAEVGAPMPIYGNGDVLSYEDYNLQKQQSGVSGIMIARHLLNVTDTYLLNVTDTYLLTVTDTYLLTVTDTYLLNVTDTYLLNVTDTYLLNVTDTYLLNVTDTYLLNVTDTYLC